MTQHHVLLPRPHELRLPRLNKVTTDLVEASELLAKTRNAPLGQ